MSTAPLPSIRPAERPGRSRLLAWLPAPVRVFLRRARFYLSLVRAGRARYAGYLIEMRLRGVDLGWQPARELGLAEDRAHAHADSGGPELAAALRKISLPKESRVLDLGCGKGGAILTFVRLGFRHVDGVELSPALCAVARRNLDRLGIGCVHIFQADAACFHDLDAYDVVYLFNPFPEKVVAAVVGNLADSLARAPRQVTLLYLNPTAHHAIVEGPFAPGERWAVGEQELQVYRARPAAPGAGEEREQA